MTTNSAAASIGRRVYGLGIISLAIVGFVAGDFLNGQPVPQTFPDRTALAYGAATFLLAAGAAIQWRKTAGWAGAALCGYYFLVVVILMNGRLWLRQYRGYGIYEDLSEQLSIGVAALIVYAANASINAALSVRLQRCAQRAFGVCALVWGGAHFVYMNLTAPLVPKWLPPSQEFWGYLTGVAFFAAGVALLAGVRARLAAALLTAMLAVFAVFVHLRMLIADHKSMENWSEAAINFTILGAAWVVADSLASSRTVDARD